MPNLEPYPDFKLDLTTAYSLLDGYLTEAESWEVYAAIGCGEYDEALALIGQLARERGARDAEEVLIRLLPLPAPTPGGGGVTSAFRAVDATPSPRTANQSGRPVNGDRNSAGPT